MPLLILLLVGPLLSAQAVAGPPGAWVGGGAAGSSPPATGARTYEPGNDPSSRPPAHIGSAKAGGAAAQWSPDPGPAGSRSGVGAHGAPASSDEGFRFRGDKTLEQAPGVESPFAPGYRFRPLTAAEQERSADVAGWRPLGRDGHRSQAPVPQEQRGDDAYGYQSDSWFRKHYGDRP